MMSLFFGVVTRGVMLRPRMFVSVMRRKGWETHRHARRKTRIVGVVAIRAVVHYPFAAPAR